MSMLHPPRFALQSSEGNHLCLKADTGAVIELFVLEEDIIRVLVLPEGKLQGPASWAVAPGAEDVPLQGRDRRDLSGFALPSFALRTTPGQLQIETALIRLSIALEGGFCQWELRQEGQWQSVLADRPTQAYNFGYWDEQVYHYLRRQPEEMYFGLGERAGDMNRAGQSYEMRNIDAMGYSARNTDPLYKHIPFYITWLPKTGAGFGLFYDTLSDCRFDMGRELDNYHGHYRYFTAPHGDLDYYFIASPGTPLAATRRFTWLTGRPAWMPKWGLGYSGSTMSYTDAPDAQVQMGQFIAKCREHDILCDSFHLSSGYTSIGPKRYVFHWNTEKFPDPHGFVRSYLDAGIHLCANIKPCLLRDHPQFEQARQAGLLICDSQGEPAWVQFWDEVGAYLDFTNPATLDWWRANVKQALLDYGVSATWNDNNEFEVWTGDAYAHGFGQQYPVRQAKVLQTMLMMQASRQAQLEAAPQRRPFLVSRSGGAGMQRYVQTWSGDNYTSWETLRYNLKMGLGLALSGVSNIGHDIGGFSGPAPAPELLVRWVAFGVFMPRFSIHSWNDDKTVNEPWMYPEVTAQIAALIKLRYRLIPYLYELLWQSTQDYQPVLRPTFAEFPHDRRCLDECDDMMLGSAMLVAPVVEQGQTERRVYLPSGARWVSYWSGERYEGGQEISLPAPWDQPVMLLREGAVIPMNVAQQQFDVRADERAFLVVPYKEQGEASGACVEDDGHSQAWRDGEQGRWQVRARSDAAAVTLEVGREGRLPVAAETLDIFLPASEQRPVQATQARIVSEQRSQGWRRLTLALST
ncbi:glycoside hydrolase family 31 protein [Herbaspirillum seropedicae]|uniref:glycoside hydrolase family 31 protein n=1 Tax=Herbaspirillum seropedicae TaxID=964 RepID=UPI002857AABF|nr:glycoside hydrolase family 31 protein [Herbaspirillum seropedicae]MDR6396067.1 alpha-glucosidase [Herbaspirillum seropedicae]